MNKRYIPLVVILGAAMVSTVFFLTVSGRRTRRSRLMIACGEDLAGQLIAYAAQTGSAGVDAVSMKQFSFLQLSDCCGTQAEFALAGGDFDMAVLCPDAAQKFLNSGVPFKILAGLVKNANVLVSRGTGPFPTVGYMNGRELQLKTITEAFGHPVEAYPIAAPALPYALECGAVDAIVLDAADAIKLRQYESGALPCDTPTAVLVVHEELLRNADFKKFVRHYNDVIRRLEDSLCSELFPRVLNVKCGEETLKAWHKMNVQLLTLPEED